MPFTKTQTPGMIQDTIAVSEPVAILRPLA
jgi:hypothetical protein